MAETLIPPFNYQKAINSLLADTDLTQTELGKALGVSQGRISQIKVGIDADKLKYETRHRLHELCIKHGLEVSDE